MIANKAYYFQLRVFEAGELQSALARICASVCGADYGVEVFLQRQLADETSYIAETTDISVLSTVCRLEGRARVLPRKLREERQLFPEGSLCRYRMLS